MEDSIAVGDAELALMHETRNHEVAVQEVVYLQQGLTFKVFVGHLQVHLIWLLVSIGFFQSLQLLFFLLQLDLAYIPY